MTTNKPQLRRLPTPQEFKRQVPEKTQSATLIRGELASRPSVDAALRGSMKDFEKLMRSL